MEYLKKISVKLMENMLEHTNQALVGRQHLLENSCSQVG